MDIRTDRFPWDPSSDAVLELADLLNPDDHSRAAEYVREVAGSVREHRSNPAYRLRHVDYPHLPGRLFDCEACEAGPCVCNVATDATCVSRQCVQSDTRCDLP